MCAHFYWAYWCFYMMNQQSALIQLHQQLLKISSALSMRRVRMLLGNLERLHLMWLLLINIVPLEELLTVCIWESGWSNQILEHIQRYLHMYCWIFRAFCFSPHTHYLSCFGQRFITRQEAYQRINSESCICQSMVLFTLSASSGATNSTSIQSSTEDLN